jgi:hypothetical protein
VQFYNASFPFHPFSPLPNAEGLKALCPEVSLARLPNLGGKYMILRTRIKLVEPEGIERSMGKAKRGIDKRVL